VEPRAGVSAGQVSVVSAATYPERVSALVVIDSLMQMTAERVSAMRGIGEGEGRSFESREAFIDGFKIRPAGSFAAPHVVRHMAHHSCRRYEDGRWRNKFDRNVYARRHPIDGYEYWARIGQPALLVAGGRSDRISPEVLARVREACPQVDLHRVPAAGHHVTLDDPIGYCDGVSTFLQSL
jgi:pimeloyl-ACP methyl ester carboxylesterase